MRKLTRNRQFGAESRKHPFGNKLMQTHNEFPTLSARLYACFNLVCSLFTVRHCVDDMYAVCRCKREMSMGEMDESGCIGKIDTSEGGGSTERSGICQQHSFVVHLSSYATLHTLDTRKDTLNTVNRGQYQHVATIRQSQPYSL